MKKQKCSDIGKIKGILFVSKYMVKKYGYEVAISKVLKRKKPDIIKVK